MAAKPKLTPEEWAKVRSTWESDPRDGYAWLIDELSIPMTRAALRKVALRDGWIKKAVSKPEVILVTVAKNARVPSKAHKNAKVLDKVLDNSPDESPINSPDHPASKGNIKKISNTKVSKVSKKTMVSKVSSDSDSDTMNEEPDTIEYTDIKSAGRPTDYREKYNRQAYRLCLLGAIDDELAEFFEVDVSTISRWKVDHPGFKDSIKKGKMLADSKVAERLYERAMGYSHPETHVSNFKGEITLTEITKHYPPDTVAAFIWLKNRQPEKWRDKIEVGVNVKLDRETLIQIEQVFMEKMTQARERQKAILVERGILIEHGQD